MKHGAVASLVFVIVLVTAASGRIYPLSSVGRPITHQYLPQAFVAPSPLGHSGVRRTSESHEGGLAVVGPWRGKQRRLRACAPKTFRGGRRERCVVAMVARSDGDGGEGSHGAGDLEMRKEEKCVRRLDIAVRRVFAAYYTCSDLREAKEPLRVFLSETTAALEAGRSPERLASLLRERLLQSSQRLDYHLDGDLPMVLYRFWLRGRAIDVYERDLFHCPRWIELISETKKKTEAALHLDLLERGDRVGTICYPNGDIFEGEVSSLVRRAQDGGGTPPTHDGGNAAPSAPMDDALDAEFSYSPDFTPSSQATWSSSGGGGSDCSLVVEPDVTTVQGLVALTIDCLRDGLSDEAAIFRRHMKSPDFGNPLLRLALPTSDLPEFPHAADEDEDERDPALVAAEAELTDEHKKLGERGAKELVHDRRRSQLDVYLICEAFRALRAGGDEAIAVTAVDPKGGGEAGWKLCDEDAQILDEMLKNAATIDP